jgi:hypothetical protein
MKGFIEHIKTDLLAKVPGAMDTDFWNFETTTGIYEYNITLNFNIVLPTFLQNMIFYN